MVALVRNWEIDGWTEQDWAKVGNVSGLLNDVAAELDNDYGGGGGGCAPADLDRHIEAIASAMRRLSEVRSGYL